ncbi:hypothetical protein F5Y15DRAFT_420092 [Xylariaceae sp. FL0016]|nr:hypothetical protein F5Y15DRAFT_420092 [Xylariaceae sp. FL0016]
MAESLAPSKNSGKAARVPDGLNYALSTIGGSKMPKHQFDALTDTEIGDEFEPTYKVNINSARDRSDASSEEAILKARTTTVSYTDHTAHSSHPQ